MVNTSALESRGRGFKSRSRQFLEFHLCSFISFFHWLQFICVMYIYIYIYIYIYPRHQYPSKREVEFETQNIFNTYTTNSQPVYFEKHYRENFDTSNYNDYVGNGCIYYGAAGCGKTTKPLKLASKATDPIILSFT